PGDLLCERKSIGHDASAGLASKILRARLRCIALNEARSFHAAAPGRTGSCFGIAGTVLSGRTRRRIAVLERVAVGPFVAGHLRPRGLDAFVRMEGASDFGRIGRCRRLPDESEKLRGIVVRDS